MKSIHIKKILITGVLFYAASASALSFASDSATGLNSKGLTLKYCYQLSLQDSMNISAKKEAVNESAGRYKQAVGAVLPHVDFSILHSKQGVDSKYNLPSSFAAEDSIQNKFSLSQPIFNGFKEFSAMSSLKYEKLQRGFEELYASRVLLGEVSDTFFNILEFEATEQVYKEIKTIIEERVKDLKERAEVGRSRKSDISSAMILFYQNEAQLTALRAQTANERKRLKYLTGLREIDALNDEPQFPQDAGQESKYIEKSSLRPEISAAQNAVFLAEKQVSAAKADFYPSVNLYGDYYTATTGKFAGIDWDLNLTAAIALLPVTQILGSVKEASAKAKEARFSFEQAKRDATLDVQSSYENYQSAALNKTTYNNALKSARENYELQLGDYKHNLISNLDLLESIQFLQSAQRDYVHAVYELKRAYVRLLVSSGQEL